MSEVYTCPGANFHSKNKKATGSPVAFHITVNLQSSDLEVADRVIELVGKILKISSRLRDKSKGCVEFFH